MRITAHRLAGSLAAAALSLGTLAGIGATAPAAEAATSSVTGVDVSASQHPNGAAINWTSVATTEEFAIVKATEGMSGSYDNPWFGRDFDGAKAAGLVVGTYHFADPGLPAADDAVGEARHYYAVVKSRQGAGVLPPALDIEEAQGLTPAQLRTWVSSFLAESKRLFGRTPIVYTGPSFWDSAVGSTSYGGYPLWIAHYTTATSPRLPAGWTSWKMWQYTSKASVPGISHVVDRNYFNGTLTQLKSFASGTSTTPARNGVCEAGELCYYYNSYEAGSMSDHKASQADYGATQPTCYEFKTAGNGQGTCVKNHAASVWNRTGHTVRVYFNSSYGGAYQSVAAGAKVNLNSTLKNQNASHRTV
ncbi:GH25 family lysozyme [Nocardioides jiangxiensis]|uniref:GH25 family lysozyme n=1 Tax=Nocardioides jiangxiensis TaxID=3064524 RepID=A0ABT9B3L7_9ACTN|nr:GH25 family lysozyme [Nocardioides sp. WY-20]MDO7869409.1 GH25 family lysozyme [Nocardioides sp. WY-20]